jgi:hypothetical protein
LCSFLIDCCHGMDLIFVWLFVRINGKFRINGKSRISAKSRIGGKSSNILVLKRFYVHFPVVLWFYYLFTVTMTTYGLQSMITWQFTTKGCTVAYTILYNRTRKRCPFNTGDCSIEVTTWAGVTVYFTYSWFKCWIFKCVYLYMIESIYKSFKNGLLATDYK